MCDSPQVPTSPEALQTLLAAIVSDENSAVLLVLFLYMWCVFFLWLPSRFSLHFCFYRFKCSAFIRVFFFFFFNSTWSFLNFLDMWWGVFFFVCFLLIVILKWTSASVFIYLFWLIWYWSTAHRCCVFFFSVCFNLGSVCWDLIFCFFSQLVFHVLISPWKLSFVSNVMILWSVHLGHMWLVFSSESLMRMLCRFFSNFLLVAPSWVSCRKFFPLSRSSKIVVLCLCSPSLGLGSFLLKATSWIYDSFVSFVCFPQRSQYCVA